MPESVAQHNLPLICPLFFHQDEHKARKRRRVSFGKRGDSSLSCSSAATSGQRIDPHAYDDSSLSTHQATCVQSQQEVISPARATSARFKRETSESTQRVSDGFGKSTRSIHTTYIRISIRAVKNFTSDIVAHKRVPLAEHH